MRNILTLALVFACSVAAAAQSTLTGKWQGQTTAGTSLTLDLTLEDTVLTGTLTRADETTPISEGKVAKDTFTFKATLGGQTESFAGELRGDELRMWLERQGPASAVKMTRVKRTPSKRPAGR